MREWIARCTWSGNMVFSGKGKHVDTRFVEAETAEDAIREVTKKMSVLSLDYGIRIDVVPLDWEGVVTAFAKYDGEPMKDHSATSAKLVITPAAALPAGALDVSADE